MCPSSVQYRCDGDSGKGSRSFRKVSGDFMRDEVSCRPSNPVSKQQFHRKLDLPRIFGRRVTAERRCESRPSRDVREVVNVIIEVGKSSSPIILIRGQTLKIVMGNSISSVHMHGRLFEFHFGGDRADAVSGFVEFSNRLPVEAARKNRDQGPNHSTVSDDAVDASGGDAFNRVWMRTSLGARIPSRTLLRPNSRTVISMSAPSATTISFSCLRRLMINMPPECCLSS